MSKFLIQRKLHTNFLTKNRRSSSWRLLDSMHRTKYTSNTPCQKLESISTSDASCSSRDVFPNDFECFFTMLRISCLRNMNHACNRSINFIFLTGTINHIESQSVTIWLIIWWLVDIQNLSQFNFSRITWKLSINTRDNWQRN